MSKIIFENKDGVSYCGDSLKLIKSQKFQKKYKGKIDLIFTSPPFNLVSKKKYGNELVTPIIFECDGGEAIFETPEYSLFRLNSDCN